ncbi:prolipoprotein diacylglyceryl transferase [Candidatus Woesearchaeota archaeon]|nr:prolipoprotein diacylglyceryl transferase [Candidatus Woesearchaeota archaeon]
MIPYKIIHAIDLGFIKIQPWGIMVAIGILISSLWLMRQAKKENFDENKLVDLILISVVLGFVFARIFELAFYMDTSTIAFIDYFKIWEGGLSFLGGLIGAFIGFVWYVKKHKINFWKTADLFTPALALGLSISRIGCYITGLHIGKITTSILGVMIDGQIRHQTALYEIIYAFIIFLILLKLKTKKLFEGALFLAFLALYSVARFTNDFLRVDPTYFGLTPTQYGLILTFILAIFFAHKKTSGFKKIRAYFFY